MGYSLRMADDRRLRFLNHVRQRLGGRLDRATLCDARAGTPIMSRQSSKYGRSRGFE
jgi:hypothetical protein